MADDEQPPAPVHPRWTAEGAPFDLDVGVAVLMAAERVLREARGDAAGDD